MAAPPRSADDDWSFDGPILGPFEAVHLTYTTHVRCFPGGQRQRCRGTGIVLPRRHFGGRNVDGGRSGNTRVLSRSIPLRSSIAVRTGSFGVPDRKSNALRKRGLNRRRTLSRAAAVMRMSCSDVEVSGGKRVVCPTCAGAGRIRVPVQRKEPEAQCCRRSPHCVVHVIRASGSQRLLSRPTGQVTVCW
jgi:hypothetical protein